MNRLTLIARLRVIANQVDKIPPCDGAWWSYANKADALEMLEHLITEIHSEREVTINYEAFRHEYFGTQIPNRDTEARIKKAFDAALGEV